MNLFNIEKTFIKKKEKNWETIYIAIDLHDTIIKGRYTYMNESPEFYPHAKEVLQFLTKRTDIKLILWTSSHNKPIEDILEWFKSHDIKFDFVNSNLDCQTTDIQNFESKFYFNILIDDKAGWSADEDWLRFKNEFVRLGEWNE